MKNPTIAGQAWLGIGLWMLFGLLVEGLIGFRAPAYMTDEVRRELFRLAHAHGTLLNLMILAAYLFLQNSSIVVPNAAIISMRAGVVLMPLGFLLGGIWHYGSDPGLGIFLAPVGGIMVIFGVISIGISTLQNKTEQIDKDK